MSRSRYDDGYQNIINVDNSEVAISQMMARNMKRPFLPRRDLQLGGFCSGSEATNALAADGCPRYLTGWTENKFES